MMEWTIKALVALFTFSVAILQYLSKKHHIDDLYPVDLQHRAKVEAFTHWQHNNLRYGGSNMFMALVGITCV